MEVTPDYFYDPVSHEYWIDGVQVRSVTQVLKDTGAIDMRWFTPEARDRGSRVHNVTSERDKLAVQWSTGLVSNGDIIGYIQAYELFLREQEPNYAAIEQALWSKIYRLAGRPDRIVTWMRDVPGGGILEIKTGPPMDWHRLQLVGYQLLQPTGSRLVLYLMPSGKYRLKRYARAEDYDDFFALLNRPVPAARTRLIELE